MGKLFASLVIFVCSLFASEENYTLGQGYDIKNTPMKIGGYISAESYKEKASSSYSMEDIALLVYGDLTPRISVMLELEAAGFYNRSYGIGNSESFNPDFAVERGYVDYMVNDSINLRVGKFNTPAGFWNAMPINILRQTTSNPWLAMNIFPRFTTGTMLNGLIDDDTYEYAVFIQKTPDLDKRYKNIDASDFVGGELKRSFSEHLVIGIAGGEFKNAGDSNEICRYFNLSGRYRNGGLEILSEWAKSFDLYRDAAFPIGNGHKDASYIQAAYRIVDKNYAIFRNEFYHDSQTKDKGTINTIGWNYKPRPAISLKAEYQFNSNTDRNSAIMSLSVLF